MQRFFVFRWCTKDLIKRTNLIKLSKASGNIGVDAKAATDLFIRAFGNLKKNTILCIQELDEKGVPIGEPITPMENTNIVPARK